jgi:catechol 2,3-dioxygenase-like lactoylglutathione lyase family enzyme
MIKRLAHACLFSSDLERTKSFYCGILGLQVKFPFLKKGRLFGFYLEVAEDQFIEVFARDHAQKNEEPHIGHICLEVDSVTGIRELLLSRGVPVTEPKLGADSSWQAWCKDPDGTDIELHEYTAQSSQRTGAECVVDR